MSLLVLSPRAKADIETIWDYTAERWGPTQAERYIRKLQFAFNGLILNPKSGRACDEIRLGYRKLLVGSHLVFYREIELGLEIIRILHQSMDTGAYL